ncbi:MAG: hypothetical protein ACRC9Q_03415 [Bacteroidales bacterium]
MNKKLLSVLFAISSLSGNVSAQTSKATIHAMNSVSHAYDFHADWGFQKQYMKDQKYAKSWCALYNADLSNTNLLFLWNCDNRLSYNDKDVKKINEFLSDGGGVVIMGRENPKSQNQLLKNYGVQFAGKATLPLKAPGYTSEDVTVKGGALTLSLDDPKKWNIIVQDKEGKPVTASRKYKKGTIVVSARTIMGDHPDYASDSINSGLWNKIWTMAAANKKVDPKKPFKNNFIETLEYRTQKDGLDISYSEYMKPYADAMFDISKRCMPVIENKMGVPLSPGMGSKIILIPTDGGGYSSGEILALAVWWGGFPDVEDSMIEFVTHEAVHSWVLPYPEIWNEPIATYVGNLVMCDMGYKEEGERRIKATIERARKYDPDFDKYDMQGKSNKEGVAPLTGAAVNEVHWGKMYWIFEQLRKQDPDIVSKYFKAKREIVKPNSIRRYDASHTVHVLSQAMNKDLFPWFQSIGFDVDRSKVRI